MKLKTYIKNNGILKSIILIEMGICFMITPDSLLNQFNININANTYNGEYIWHAEREDLR